MIVPPARTSGGAGIGFGGVFCEARAIVAAKHIKIAAQRTGNEKIIGGCFLIRLGNSLLSHRPGNNRGKTRGNTRVMDRIVRVFLILLHGSPKDGSNPNQPVGLVHKRCRFPQVSRFALPGLDVRFLPR